MRCSLQKVDDATAARAIQSLWEHRAEFLARTAQMDSVPNVEGRHLALVGRLLGQQFVGRGSPHLPAFNWRLLVELRDELARIALLQPQEQGYSFETFLRRSFDMAGLSARKPFRNTGEQIDGSFILGEETYLLEAKWHSLPPGIPDLLPFYLSW